MKYACDDYKKVAETLDSVMLRTATERLALDTAIALCEAVAAKETAEIDPDEERAHCYRVASNWAQSTGLYPGDPCPTSLVLREREDARLQAIMSAHVAYRELTDAVADFLHSPDSLERLTRAFEKTRGL